jgi:hypothetical protein
MNQNFQIILNAIEGEYPEYQVDILGIPFIVRIPDINLSQNTSLEFQISFLEKCVKTPILAGAEFVKELPFLYYVKLWNTLLEKWTKFQEMLDIELEEFIESDFSRSKWIIYKESKDSKLNLVNGTLTELQKRWICANAVEDKKEKHELIVNVIDALKPWLDHEMYFKLKESEKNTRVNAFYDEDIDTIELNKEVTPILKGTK